MKRLSLEDPTLDFTPTSSVLYHCIWFGPFLPHLQLSLASLFHTQHAPTVYLWTDRESYDGLQCLKPLFSESSLDIRIPDFIVDLDSYYAPSFRSDYWRFCIVWEYGGLYFDLDVLFLKDLSWTSRYPFVQEGFITENVFNTAIMYFPPQHEDVGYWLAQVREETHLDWKRLFQIQSYAHPYSCFLFPNAFLDYSWTVVSTFSTDDFFQKDLPIETLFATNSFAYHWHNRYSLSVTNENTLVGKCWNHFCT